MKTVLKLSLLSITIILISCAVQRVEVPVFEGIDFKEVLNSKKDISVINTIFSITFAKDDTEMKGEGVLNISRNGNLNLRVYSLGFLALEILSENGFIKSNLRIDKNKSRILTEGLRDCFFWWDIDDYTVNEGEDMVFLKNLTREIWLDRKTMLPVKQVILLEDGRELIINYADNEKLDGVWYPSCMRIELLKYSVRLKVKDISFNGSI
ncbi:MAG: hypothetical protein HXY47_05490 [Nitrospirae bacterium]|nr:hypothetical protein [Nitrospirota bacterium]